MKHKCSTYLKRGLYNQSEIIKKFVDEYPVYVIVKVLHDMTGIRINKRKYWTVNDFEQIEKNIDSYVKAPKNNSGRCENQDADNGLYSINRAADFLGMPRITMTSWLQTGKIEKPTHPGKAKNFCWTEQELKQIKKKMKKYFEKREDK